MNDDEVRNRMYELRSILSEFWKDGFISSKTSSKIIDMLPPRLRNL